MTTEYDYDKLSFITGQDQSEETCMNALIENAENIVLIREPMDYQYAYALIHGVDVNVFPSNVFANEKLINSVIERAPSIVFDILRAHISHEEFNLRAKEYVIKSVDVMIRDKSIKESWPSVKVLCNQLERLPKSIDISENEVKRLVNKVKILSSEQ